LLCSFPSNIMLSKLYHLVIFFLIQTWNFFKKLCFASSSYLWYFSTAETKPSAIVSTLSNCYCISRVSSPNFGTYSLRLKNFSSLTLIQCKNIRLIIWSRLNPFMSSSVILNFSLKAKSYLIWFLRTLSSPNYWQYSFIVC
jgi:hypothetical protein